MEDYKTSSDLCVVRQGPYEYLKGLIRNSRFEQATNRLSRCFVLFSADDRPSGSSTLLDVDGSMSF